jgi:hypothetical protein
MTMHLKAHMPETQGNRARSDMPATSTGIRRLQSKFPWLPKSWMKTHKKPIWLFLAGVKATTMNLPKIFKNGYPSKFCEGVRVAAALQLVFTALILSVPSDAQVTDRRAEAKSSISQVTGSQAEAMIVLWSSALPYQVSPQGAPPNLVLTDMAQSAKEFTFLSAKGDALAKGDADHPFLIVGADQSGPGRLIPLTITGWDLRLARGPGQTIWIGGVKNPGVLWTGAPVSEAYLAKLDLQGHVIWEREFGSRRKREIQSLSALPSGEVVVAGRDDQRTWLARISGDGKVVWERYLGVGKGASITTVGDEIAVAAFEASAGSVPLSNPYREDVGFWAYDHAGQLLDHRVIRQGINRAYGAYGGTLTIEPFGDEIYISSKWLAENAVKPLEIVKINSSRQTVWRKELPETAAQVGNKITGCLEAITILANGDPLVTCSYPNKIHLFQFNSQTGEPTQGWVQQPTPPLNCDERSSSAKFLAQIDDALVWVFGSSSRCTWLGQLSLTRLPSAQ